MISSSAGSWGTVFRITSLHNWKVFQCQTLKLEKRRGCGTPLIYLPTVNVTSIWHLVGGETGPGWQEMKAELHHNELVAPGQLSLCVQKIGVIMKTGSFCTLPSQHLRNQGRAGTVHCSLCRHRSRNQGLSSRPSEKFRGISSPLFRRSVCPDGTGPSCQHTYWPFRGSGSACSIGRSSDWPRQRPARRLGPK